MVFMPVGNIQTGADISLEPAIGMEQGYPGV